MTIIGRFTKNDADYVGAIATLTVRAEDVRIVADINRTNPTSPSHRVYAGMAEIGVGWPKWDKTGREFLNLKVDDPSFPGPIYPTLVQSTDNRTFVLLWSRANSTLAAS